MTTQLVRSRTGWTDGRGNTYWEEEHKGVAPKETTGP